MQKLVNDSKGDCTARAASRKARRSSSGIASDLASRSARPRDGRRLSASIFRIEKCEQLTRREDLLVEIQRAPPPQPAAERIGAMQHLTLLCCGHLIPAVVPLLVPFCGTTYLLR